MATIRKAKKQSKVIHFSVQIELLDRGKSNCSFHEDYEEMFLNEAIRYYHGACLGRPSMRWSVEKLNVEKDDDNA